MQLLVRNREWIMHIDIFCEFTSICRQPLLFFNTHPCTTVLVLVLGTYDSLFLCIYLLGLLLWGHCNILGAMGALWRSILYWRTTALPLQCKLKGVNGGGRSWMSCLNLGCRIWQKQIESVRAGDYSRSGGINSALTAT